MHLQIQELRLALIQIRTIMCDLIVDLPHKVNDTHRSTSYTALFAICLVEVAGPTGSYDTAYCHLCSQQSSEI